MPKETHDVAAIYALTKAWEAHPEYRDIVIGGIYEHCLGGKYMVIDIHRDATNYEETKDITFSVKYEQLYTGDFPAGTVYTRQIDDFVGTIEIGGKFVKKFTYKG